MCMQPVCSCMCVLDLIVSQNHYLCSCMCGKPHLLLSGRKRMQDSCVQSFPHYYASNWIIIGYWWELYEVTCVVSMRPIFSILYRRSRHVYTPTCTLIFWLCCSFLLLPFCIKACKDVVHVCPDCHTRIGCYRRCK